MLAWKAVAQKCAWRSFETSWRLLCVTTVKLFVHGTELGGSYTDTLIPSPVPCIDSVFSQGIQLKAKKAYIDIRADSRFAPSQWATSLHSNVVFHLESALNVIQRLSMCKTSVFLAIGRLFKIPYVSALNRTSDVLLHGSGILGHTMRVQQANRAPGMYGCAPDSGDIYPGRTPGPTPRAWAWGHAGSSAPCVESPQTCPRQHTERSSMAWQSEGILNSAEGLVDWHSHWQTTWLFI